METKFCNRCKTDKPVYEFHTTFHKQLGRDILRSWCKVCHNYYASWTKAQHPDRARSVGRKCAAKIRAARREVEAKVGRLCKFCKEVKPLAAFGYLERERLRKFCDACAAKRKEELRVEKLAWQKEDVKRRRAADPMYYRKQGLRQNYGLTVEKYGEMLAGQGGGCEICGGKESDQPKGVLSVDHDHKTGKVRALLCADCNSALGGFRDSATILARAIEYLKKHGTTDPALSPEPQPRVGGKDA